MKRLVPYRVRAIVQPDIVIDGRHYAPTRPIVVAAAPTRAWSLFGTETDEYVESARYTYDVPPCYGVSLAFESPSHAMFSGEAERIVDRLARAFWHETGRSLTGEERARVRVSWGWAL